MCFNMLKGKLIITRVKEVWNKSETSVGGKIGPNDATTSRGRVGQCPINDGENLQKGSTE